MFKHFLAALVIACTFTNTKATAQDISVSVNTSGIQTTISDLKTAGSNNHFAIGALQALGAIEHALQTRWQYNIAPSGMAVPLLRLQIGKNSDASRSQPDTLSNLMRDFLDEIETAKSELILAQNNPDAEFILNLSDLWFDVNANGSRDKTEGADAVVGNFLIRSFGGRGNQLPPIEALEIRFDSADVHWLHAYTELLSAVANILLAFDPAPVFTRMKAGADMLANAPENPPIYTTVEADALIAKIETRLKELSESNDAVEATNEVEALEARREDIRRKSGRDGRVPQFEHLRSELDLIYILLSTMAQDPDKAHIKAAQQSLQTMVAQNKLFWAELPTETDNDREWIPNADQTAALGYELPANAGELWQRILADVELVLDGRLLIPHPVLPTGYGINLAAYFENPVGLDLVGSVHGMTFYPYAQKGPRISGTNWRIFSNSLRGRAMLTAVLFN